MDALRYSDAARYTLVVLYKPKANMKIVKLSL